MIAYLPLPLTASSSSISTLSSAINNSSSVILLLYFLLSRRHARSLGRAELMHTNIHPTNGQSFRMPGLFYTYHSFRQPFSSVLETELNGRAHCTHTAWPISLAYLLYTEAGKKYCTQPAYTCSILYPAGFSHSACY